MDEREKILKIYIAANNYFLLCIGYCIAKTERTHVREGEYFSAP